MPALVLCLAGAGLVLMGLQTPGFIMIMGGLAAAVVRGLYW